MLRVWDPEWPAEVERRHGLEPGSLAATAFAWERLLPALLGQVSHDEWMRGVAEALTNEDAVAEWQTYRGEIDPQVLGFVRELRAGGVPVALATNATDLLATDLAEAGLAGEFDAVVSSAVLGLHKPTREYFVAACAAVGRSPGQCLFVDDSARNVLGARAAGLYGYRWNGVGDLHYLRGTFTRHQHRG